MDKYFLQYTNNNNLAKKKSDFTFFDLTEKMNFSKNYDSYYTTTTNY